MKNEQLKYYESRPIILFDGYCNLCSSSVQIVLRKERKEYYYFASLQSDFVRNSFGELYSEKKDPETVVLIEKGKPYFKSDAALRICRKLKFPFYILSYFRFLPVFLRDPVYDLVSRNRYRIFGKKNSCYIPDKKYSHRFLE
jgi:predicted DCC family thiol-disulfide oxidoreductase YuxK